MLCPVWSCLFALLGVIVFHVGEVRGQCWQSVKCMDLDSEDGILECIKACKADLSAESPIFPGNGHLQPLSENIRKYVMSHFRWNKFGRRNSTGSDGNSGSKREDIANYPIFNLFPGSNGPNAEDGSVEEDQDRQDNKRSYSMEHFRWGKPVGKKRRPIKVFPNGMEEESSESYPVELRRELTLGDDYPEIDSEIEDDLDDSDLLSIPKKKGGNYRIHHFRWGSPPKDKRYGGFMTPERSQTPLMTLFKNAIIKNAHKKAQQ